MIIKKKLVLISLILFIIILFIQNIFALTANSSSYSISMFGNKLVTANPSSISYDSTVLSEVQGTTRNAEADSYSTNVGFFSGTIPYKTVQISSYSIYPTSAVTGSIISFKVSAINAQSIWLKMTLPNSMEETINLTNNVYSYYTADLVGIYSITFYANSSTNSLTSVLDSFEITSPITSSSTGGGTSCKYIWDCGSWSICSPDGKQTRTCKNIGTCTGEEGKPIEERNCSEALFDVKLKLGQLELTTNESLAFNVNLIQTKSIEKIDVQIKYSIIDKNENEIFSQIETRAIETGIDYRKTFDELKLSPGEYTLRIDIVYGNMQKANAEQTFTVKETGKIEVGRNYLPIIIGIIFLIFMSIIIIFLIKRFRKNLSKLRKPNSYKGRIKENLKKIKARNYLIIILGFFILISFFIFGKSIIGFAINSEGNLSNNLGIIGIMFIILLIGTFIFIYRKKIKEFIETIKIKYSENSVKGLIKRKLYTDEGDYLGKIEDIILKENRIDSLKIKVHKKHRRKIRAKGIVIGYENVKGLGQIFIIDKKVLEKINS